jgi:hypothetical protein
MTYLPNELINLILSFVERPQHSKLMKYIIEDCYEEDYDPYTAEYYNDNFSFEYTFVEWYFLYRKNRIYKGKKNPKYKHTPSKLLIGIDVIGSNQK